MKAAHTGVVDVHAMKKWIHTPDPETLVDRLNGIYPSAVGPYAPSPINKEAAAEIVRLREVAERLENLLSNVCEIKFPGWESHRKYSIAINDLRSILDNKKPAEAG